MRGAALLLYIEILNSTTVIESSKSFLQITIDR